MQTMKTENVHNSRSKKWFSGKEVDLYPTAAPVGEAYSVYAETLKGTCEKSTKPLSILELGCGTGRYFFFLSNVRKLTGVDISADMLKSAAQNIENNLPALVPVTNFVNSSIEAFNTNEKYDFIFSIGTLGEYCVFNTEVLTRILSYLNTNGFLFFTIVDSESFANDEYVGLRKRLLRSILKIFPEKIRDRFDARALVIADWKDLFLSKDQVEAVLRSSPVPLEWELTRAKDSLHVHHICKLRVKREKEV